MIFRQSTWRSSRFLLVAVVGVLLAAIALGQQGRARWQRHQASQANKATAAAIERDARWPALLAAIHEGDIIFHTSRSAQSQAVQQATGSRYSHMGIVLWRDGKPRVFEASATVKYTPLAEWIARGVDGHYVLKRLKTAEQTLTPQALERLHQTADALAGKRYDLTFEWSDERMYCSELVWKIYHRALGIDVGALQKIREFNLNAPAVQQKIRERYGSQGPPLDEPVISPQAMLDSPLLVDVAVTAIHGAGGRD